MIKEGEAVCLKLDKAVKNKDGNQEFTSPRALDIHPEHALFPPYAFGLL